MNADDILDAEEVYDDAPESGHAYADLAAAMGDEEDSDQDEEEGEEQEGAELGSDADDDNDLDLVSDEEDNLGLSDMDDADSADEGSDMDDPDHSDQQADDPDDDELNPFELAEATDSDDEPKQKGALGLQQCNHPFCLVIKCPGLAQASCQLLLLLLPCTAKLRAVC